MHAIKGKRSLYVVTRKRDAVSNGERELVAGIQIHHEARHCSNDTYLNHFAYAQQKQDIDGKHGLMMNKNTSFKEQWVGGVIAVQSKMADTHGFGKRDLAIEAQMR